MKVSEVNKLGPYLLDRSFIMHTEEVNDLDSLRIDPSGTTKGGVWHVPDPG